MKNRPRVLARETLSILLASIALPAACGERPGEEQAAEVRDDSIPAGLRSLLEEPLQDARAEPGDPRKHARLGLVYEANGLWEQAAACFRRAAELDARDPLPSYHLALVLEGAGKPDDAIEALRGLVLVHADFVPAQHRLGELTMEAGLFDEAERALRAAVERAPEAPETHVSLGDLLQRRGEEEAATSELRRAIELDPTYAAAHYLLGLVLRRTGREAEALEELRLGANARKRSLADAWAAERLDAIVSLEARLEQAEALSRDGRHEEEAAVLERTLELHPQAEKALVNLAAVSMRLGRLDRALALLQRARERNETSAVVHMNLAGCLLAMHRPAEAIESAERATLLAPEAAQARFLLGEGLWRLGFRDRALEAMAEADRLEPSNASLLTGYAGSLAAAGRLAEARAAFVRLCELLPGRWEPWLDLFRCALEMGDVEGARAALERARAIGPEAPAVRAAAEAFEGTRSEG